MTDYPLMVEIDGKSVPLANCLWLFFRSCGCPFGLHNAGTGVATERQAWKAFYDTERERNHAQNRGVTCRLIDRPTYSAEYFQKMLDDDCQHRDDTPPLLGKCSVCGRRLRLKADGTLYHHAGKPMRYGYGRREYRCEGAGKPPKEGA